MNGWPGAGGSPATTSKAAPEIWPDARAGPTAASSTSPPRAVLTSSGARRMDANSAAPIKWVAPFTFENYTRLWIEKEFYRNFLNTVLVTVFTVTISLTVGCLAGYGLSRYRGSLGFWLLLVALVFRAIPHSSLLPSFFTIFDALGIRNTYFTLIFVLVAINQPFTIWMLQSYFNSIPRDLEEAAWMDGASHLTSLIRIFLPLAVPAIVVTAIFTFINSWNEFVLALTMMRSSEDFTLPVQIYSQVAGRYQVEWHHVMAGTVLATVPVAILFSWLQRYLIRGMALGAVK